MNKSGESKSKGRKKILGGVLILLIIIVVSAVMYLFMRSTNESEAKEVVVSVDGAVKYVESIKEDKTFQVETDDGYNEVEIEDGNVSVIEADCGNQVCVRTAPISHVGESIVCLPHKVVVEIR